MRTSRYGNPAVLSRRWRLPCGPDVQHPARAGESRARAGLPGIRKTTHVYGASVSGNTSRSYTAASVTVQAMLDTCS